MRLRIIAFTVASMLASSGRAQVIQNQIDTFESGIANWQNSAGFGTVQAGGPGGAADHFLQLATNGATSGMGSLLVGFNQNQWIGNYTAQGINAIEMDLKNINYAPGMLIRIAFRTGTGGLNTPAYVSNAFPLPEDNAWHHAVFALSPVNFTGVNSPPAFDSVLAGGNQDFRILHNNIANAIGAATSPTAAQLGIDNIHAIAVPEPGSMALCGAAAIGALGAYRRRNPGWKSG
jgi:hypothetical protein